MLPVVLVIGAVALIWYLSQRSAPSTNVSPPPDPAVPGASSQDGGIRGGFPITKLPPGTVSVAPQLSWKPIGHKGHPTVPITPGARFRLSASPQTIASAAFQWNLGATKDGVAAMVQNFLPMKGARVVVYGPGEVVPADWPGGDPNAQGGWRVEGVATAKATYTDLGPSGWTGWVLA